jgi:RHS repeat-associated protein
LTCRLSRCAATRNRRSRGSHADSSRTQYDPYGDLFNGTDPVGIGYAGHVNDLSTGLSYQQQRYYDPLLGRFITADPVAADVNSGGNFNRYWYANNSPYRYRDPDGRCVEDLCIGEAILVSRLALGAYRAYKTAQSAGRLLDNIARVEPAAKPDTEPTGGSGAKVPPELQPVTNPPQAPVIPPDWVSYPGPRGGAEIYHPPGASPQTGGDEWIRVMPPGSSNNPGQENGYWEWQKGGQPRNPATGKPGNRGETHVPLPPESLPPRRRDVVGE